MPNQTQGRLAGKTAVITGGTTGIGFETARRYLAEGAQVIITGRNPQRLEEAVAQLGEGATGVRADVASSEEMSALAAEVKGLFGSLDIVFANAGIGVFGPIDGIDEVAFDRQFDVNVKGVFLTVQQLLPLLNEGGSIVLTASAVHGKGVPTGSVYFASKAAVRSFARSFAAELGPRGIRVNSLSPGIVRTAFDSKLDLPDGAFEGFIDMVVKGAPLGREGTSRDMGDAAVFLASDESSYMTGADLTVDGGWMNV